MSLTKLSLLTFPKSNFKPAQSAECIMNAEKKVGGKHMGVCKI